MIKWISKHYFAAHDRHILIQWNLTKLLKIPSLYTVARTLGDLGFSIVIIGVMIHACHCNFGRAVDYRWLPVYRRLCCNEVCYRFYCRVLTFCGKLLSFECTGRPGTSREDPGNGCYHPWCNAVRRRAWFQRSNDLKCGEESESIFTLRKAL